MLVQILQSRVKLSEVFKNALTTAGHVVQPFETIADLQKASMACSSNILILVLNGSDITLADVWSVSNKFPEKAIVVFKDDACLESVSSILNMGADDCVHIHACPSEILARMVSVVCRKHGHSRPIFNMFGMEINLLERSARYMEKMISLKDYEFGIIEQYVLRNSNIIPLSILGEIRFIPEEQHVKRDIRSTVKSFQRKMRSRTDGNIVVSNIPFVGVSISSRKYRSSECNGLDAVQSALHSA